MKLKNTINDLPSEITVSSLGADCGAGFPQLLPFRANKKKKK